MPERFKILSGSCLKIIAIMSMLIDHIALFILKNYDSFITPLFFIGTKEITIFFILRSIGRIAFPIFAYLIVEGFIHTHDRIKYGMNLLLFAILSEIPYNLIHSGTWHYPIQNVIFTLFLGYLSICALEYFNHDRKKLILTLLGLLLVSIVFKADYGCSGFGFILMLYVLRNNKLVQAIIGSCFLSSRWIAGLAFIPLNMYNGKRGFIKGNYSKYFFYVFYLGHLLILYFIKTAVLGLS